MNAAPPPCRKRGFLPWFLLGAAVAALAAPRQGMAQSVWELTPYRVRILVGVERTAEFTPALEADLRAELASRIDDVIGAAWDTTVSAPEAPLRHAMTTRLEDIDAAGLSSVASDFDKVILVALGAGAGERRVTAREFDVRTQTFNTPASLPVWQSAKLGDTLFRAVLDAFAPLAKIQKADRRAASLRLRAAALPLCDENLKLVRPGFLFRPLVRYNDRDGNIKRINAIPWTYLVVDEIASEAVECKLVTGLRSPLSGRRRGRVEPLALAVLPPKRPTRLTLETETDPPQRLAGYEIHAQRPGEKATTLLGYTDWQGGIEIPPADDPLRIILVKSGGRLLAKLPLVPGQWPRRSALVADDNARLEAEGFTRGLAQQLVDIVIRREVLVTRARAYIREKQFDKAAGMVGALQRLETRDHLNILLNRGRARIVSDSAGMQKRIDALFDKTAALVEKHLNPESVENMAGELSRARAK